MGVIQGFAEWLPISSTAHLRVTEHFLGFQATPLFNLFLHVGTLGVVLFYFRSDIKIILIALVHRDFHSEQGRFIPLIVIATIPTAIIGVLYDHFLANNYQTLPIMGVTFFFGAGLVYFSKFGNENQTQISTRQAIIIGAAQGASIFPGLSRSGSTISTGLLQGGKRELVFKFSFLLSIPAIIGDLAVEAYLQSGTLVEGVGVTPINLGAGLLFTVVAGYLAIVLVRKLILTRRFHYFAAYSLSFGILLVTLALLGY